MRDMVRWGVGIGKKLVKEHKLSVRRNKSGDVLYNIVTIMNNNVLYT
jgi:hypothetical protein